MMNQTHVQQAQNNAIQNKMGAGGGGGGGGNRPVKDNKPRGRMTAYAFFVQTCREEHKKKHPEEQVIFAEFSRKCAERWKMLDKEKQRFHEMAEKDKARYELEMQSYVPPKGTVVGKGKKRKAFKDPNAPKRSLSAFFWFCHEERNKVKALNPEYGVGDIAKELGRKWSDMDAEVKSRYEQMAEKDKARYEAEMTEYKIKCKNEQGGQVQGQALNLGGLQNLHVQQAAAAQLQAQVQQQLAAQAAAAAAAAAAHHADDDDDDEGDEDDNE